MNTAYIIANIAIISILWLNVGVYAVREMNETDNDAANWNSVPLWLKAFMIAIGPIALLIYDRHILDTKK